MGAEVSFSIREGVYQAEANVVSCRAIMDKYPDAFIDGIPDGARVWVSPSVTPNGVCTVANAEGHVSFCAYDTVGGKRVFLPGAALDLHALSAFKVAHPESYALMVASVAKSCTGRL